MFLLWPFGLLIFYRVMTTIMFREPVTVLTAGMLAIATTLVVFFSAGAYVFAYGKYSAKRASGEQSSLGGALMVVSAGAALGNIVLGCLIILGFSSEFADRNIGWKASKHYGTEFYEQPLLWIGVVLAIPVAVHYLMTFYSIKSLDSKGNG